MVGSVPFLWKLPPPRRVARGRPYRKYWLFLPRPEVLFKHRSWSSRSLASLANLSPNRLGAASSKMVSDSAISTSLGFTSMIAFFVLSWEICTEALSMNFMAILATASAPSIVNVLTSACSMIVVNGPTASRVKAWMLARTQSSLAVSWWGLSFTISSSLGTRVFEHFGLP